MSEFLINLIFLVVGAGISLVTAFFLNERSHKLALEDRKRERAFDAREIRLKEGEDKIKEYSNQFDHFERMLRVIINMKEDSDVSVVTDLLTGFMKTNEEMDKVKTIYHISVKSLGDERLTKALEKVSNSLDTYSDFYVHLLGLYNVNGISAMQKEKEKNIYTKQVLMQNYLSSVEEFLKRINELRSQ